MRMNVLKIIICLVLMASCSKGQEADTNKRQEKIQLTVNSLNSVENFEKENDLVLDYELYEKIEVDLNYDGIIDTIRLLKLKDWGDPGDFHKVEILTNDSKYELSNIDGWIHHNWKIKQQCCSLYDSSIKLLKIGKNASVLLIEGYPYASDPPILSVITINSKKGIKLIMNDNKYLFEVSDIDKDLIPEIKFGNSKDEILTQEFNL